MIDEPVPTMPLRVPAIRPTMRTKRKFKDCNSETEGMLKILSCERNEAIAKPEHYPTTMANGTSGCELHHTRAAQFLQG